MLVEINNQKTELPEGSTIKQAIETTNAPYTKGTVVCVIKGEKEFEKNINRYKIKTPQGSIIIELLIKTETQALIDIWKTQYTEFKECKIRWTTSNEVAMGPITTQLTPTKTEYQYTDTEVIMSLSGFSNESTHIIFSKDDHKAVYGVPEYNRGVFARIIGGIKTLNKLKSQDTILDIEPIIERSTFTDIKSISDLNQELEDGNKLYTYIAAETTTKSAQSSEHFFTLINSSKIKVDYESNSFVGFYELQGLKKPAEAEGPRQRGTITLRNTGKGAGNVYIYKEDRVASPTHTIIGYITQGMELLEVVQPGEYITVKSHPERIITIGLTQKQAKEYLKEKNIKHTPTGDTNDDAVIVMQEPRYSVQIAQEKQVTTIGVSPEKIVTVQLNEDAPIAHWYFKKSTGLLELPVGQLQVSFAHPSMNMIIFEGSPKDMKVLTPENTPEDAVPAWEIGITNMSRKNAGMIGIRFEDSSEFGPTAEPFTATNIIGKVITGKENLKKFKTGDTVYVSEYTE